MVQINHLQMFRQKEGTFGPLMAVHWQEAGLQHLQMEQDSPKGCLKSLTQEQQVSLVVELQAVVWLVGE